MVRKFRNIKRELLFEMHKNTKTIALFINFYLTCIF
jgi:hypothetical protein